VSLAGEQPDRVPAPRVDVHLPQHGLPAVVVDEAEHP
jgi:hypothetical protein